MKKHKLLLPDKFINQLVALPETGMGYQLVKVVLNNGLILSKQKVFNSSLLQLEADEDIPQNEIERIELEK